MRNCSTPSRRRPAACAKQMSTNSALVIRSSNRRGNLSITCRLHRRMRLPIAFRRLLQQCRAADTSRRRNSTLRCRRHCRLRLSSTCHEMVAPTTRPLISRTHRHTLKPSLSIHHIRSQSRPFKRCLVLVCRDSRARRQSDGGRRLSKRRRHTPANQRQLRSKQLFPLFPHSTVAAARFM